MSNEFEPPEELITPDLAVFESQLRSLPIADSKLHRDELLYQAGWSAAVAAQSIRSLALPPNWGWKISTGVMASLAALLAIMLFQQSAFIQQRQPGLADNTLQENKDTTELESISTPANELVDRLVENDSARSLPGVINKQWLPPVFLVNDSRAWRIKSDPTQLTAGSNIRQLDWTTTPVHELDFEFVTKAKTAIELLREMIPAEKRNTGKIPFWQRLSQTWGESI